MDYMNLKKAVEETKGKTATEAIFDFVNDYGLSDVIGSHNAAYEVLKFVFEQAYSAGRENGYKMGECSGNEAKNWYLLDGRGNKLHIGELFEDIDTKQLRTAQGIAGNGVYCAKDETDVEQGIMFVPSYRCRSLKDDTWVGIKSDLREYLLTIDKEGEPDNEELSAMIDNIAARARALHDKEIGWKY